MSGLDPYETPQSSLEAQPPNSSSDQFEFITVGKGIRLANLLLDYVGVSLLGFVMGLAAITLGGDAVLEGIEEIPDTLLGIPILLTYYTILEGLFGVTFGKLVTGTKVVRPDGSPIGLGTAFGRSLCRLIPFEAFSFLGQETRGWHDSISGTYVIKR